MTDEERREVARKLRELPDDVYLVEKAWHDEGIETCCHDQTDYYQIHDAVLDILPADYMHPCDYAELHDRLADLIDRPTCGNVSEFGSHTVTVSNFADDRSFDFVCSRCGIHLDGDEMDSSPLTDEKFAHHALRYCPNCGAEVVK